MSDDQTARTSLEDRALWWEEERRARPASRPRVNRWYAQDSREGIRDETFRVWKQYAALLEDSLPTTSSTPRYRLARDFADLFDPGIDDEPLQQAIADWQSRHLPTRAQARVALLRQQSTRETGQQVKFPDGNTRTLAVGPSTPLLKAAIEEFAPRFTHSPVILLATESRRRIAYEDVQQLALLRINPDARVMPDLFIADVAAPSDSLQFIFLECVATGGAMTAERVDSIKRWLTANGFEDTQSAFGTVFADRSSRMFRQHISQLSSQSFAWFASEPGYLVLILEDGAFEPRQTLDRFMGPSK